MEKEKRGKKGRKGKKRGKREKRIKEGNGSKKAGNIYFVSLFTTGPYNRKKVRTNSKKALTFNGGRGKIFSEWPSYIPPMMG